MQISTIGQYEDDKMYKLTSKRMKTVNDCLTTHNGKNPNYPHTGTACSGKYLYQSLEFDLISDLSLAIFHSQQFQTVAYNVRNRQRAKRKIISDDDSDDDFQSTTGASIKIKSNVNKV